MDKEQRIAALSKTIRRHNAALRERTKNLRASLEKLKVEIGQQLLFFELLKDETRSELIGTLAKILKITPTEANEIWRVYKFLMNRNKVDKLFLENAGVIDRANRKTPHRNNAGKKSALMTVGTLCSDVRALAEKKNLSQQEKEIIKSMLQQLKEEL
jgi:phage antirepressor YoqD-like protein